MEVNGWNRGTKNFAHLYMPILIADRIGLNFAGVYINSYKYDFSPNLES